ncbi:hypothetical protein DUT90_00105 [Polaribacter sp. WD7]|uniref:hypothetical protein n=1 Tax=Polaribacter sp. WD7 TaxID=2269061 RepID=UPI000DF32958|nr:hypothetical protein [Polaribacter sp. WD7]RCS28522.1 hypothetical protein DUT90_00105 [Polaribacter sp. WD7]
MDMTTQIKNNLISRIKTSSDLSFLKALQTIFDTSEQGLYQLSSEQETSISIGKKQIKSGEFSKNESVISEMKEWLTKK